MCGPCPDPAEGDLLLRVGYQPLRLARLFILVVLSESAGGRPLPSSRLREIVGMNPWPRSSSSSPGPDSHQSRVRQIADPLGRAFAISRAHPRGFWKGEGNGHHRRYRQSATAVGTSVGWQKKHTNRVADYYAPNPCQHDHASPAPPREVTDLAIPSDLLPSLTPHSFSTIIRVIWMPRPTTCKTQTARNSTGWTASPDHAEADEEEAPQQKYIYG